MTTIQMTDDQLQTLIAALRPQPQPQPVAAGGPNTVAGAAAVVGTMPPCPLGKNKLKRYKKWCDWIRDAETKMTFLEMTTEIQKMNFIRSCAGPELNEFWLKEARIRFEAIPASTDGTIPAQPAHSYEELKAESKAALLKLVSRDRAIIELLRMEQGGRSFMDFLAEIEDQEHLCRTDELRITSDDLKRMSLIAGMNDRTLAEKALAEEYSLKQVIQAGVNRESSRANVEAMQAKPTSVNRLAHMGRIPTSDLDSRIDHLQSELDEVMRIRQSGKYSNRFRSEDSPKPKKKCQKCTYNHAEGLCPAEGRMCNACGQEGHFSRSRLCRSSRGYKSGSRKSTTRRVIEDTPTPSEESEEELYTPVSSIRSIRPSREDTVLLQWPGVAEGVIDSECIQLIQRQETAKRNRQVHLLMGGRNMNLYCDTGSRFTIIPPDLYKADMGEVIPARCHLRAWGADTHLDTKGMFRTTLVTSAGAKKATWVYVVGGTDPEPLLGDADAEDLGIIKFIPEGRPATAEELQNTVNQVQETSGSPRTPSGSIPAKLRRAGITVCSEKPTLPPVADTTYEECMATVQEYTGPVFTERTGHMKTSAITLQYDTGFQPMQPPRIPVPYHYRDRLAVHLQKLKSEDIIDDVAPSEPIDCVLNVLISEKKAAGDIRMNIDARPLNVGAKHTKYHVTTPQEVRHLLDGATVFSEMDMGNGYHQVPLAPESQVVFRTHKGLHRMKRLFFGPKNSSGIFHHEVRKAFTGIDGCITIHDNILVYGRDGEEHNRNLRATLQRAKEKGITFKLSKSTFCAPEVTWFGRVFSAAGVSADPEKIQTITGAGRPENIEDVKSLLQAAAYNAKFAYDHQEAESYEEVTAPLRELLMKEATFSWDDRREESFLKLLKMMNDKSILTPFIIGRPTHLVTDASPHGISASLYQEDDSRRWLPIDHISRALSRHEQGWKSQIEWESLAKMWGMTMFRPYLVGTKFTSWGDHQPLLSFYNNLTKPATARITKHRYKIMDLTFTDKYLPGKKMPGDYNSRHPAPITHLNSKERATLLVDDGDEVQIMRVMMADLPPALTLKMIQQAALSDPVYQKLIQAVQQGKKPEDPSLTPYTSVWGELSTMQQLVCRGERIIIPNSELPGGEGNLRDWVVDLGHSGHLGINATKRLLRQRLWFPGMDKMVERRVAACLPCQAATESHHRDPLKPNPAPAEPWFRVYCDHWGPTQFGDHILVVMDGLTRYPEAVVVRGTSAEDNIHAFSEIFSRHGVPEILHSDNGPPFNGRDSHLLQQYFQNFGIQHLPNHSAEDPEATGLVEAFMKHIKKLFHTSSISHTDPYLALHNHLLQVRATPHPSTSKSPAELLFGRKFRTKLPDLRQNPAQTRPDILAARATDARAKERMKHYKDNPSTVKPHKIHPGDRVLLKQKTTKHRSVYDPQPYVVTRTWGTQIEGQRDGVIKRRDAQRWKKIHTLPTRQYQNPRARSNYLEDPDIGATNKPEHPHNPPKGPSFGRTPTIATDPPEGHQDLLAAWRRHPNVILSETVANRPTRTRRPPRVIYQPGPQHHPRRTSYTARRTSRRW